MMKKTTTTTFNIRFPKGAQIGQTYFQCVYLEAELTSNLLHAREKAIELFDIRDARRYRAHVFSVGLTTTCKAAVTVEAESGRSV